MTGGITSTTKAANPLRLAAIAFLACFASGLVVMLLVAVFLPPAVFIPATAPSRIAALDRAEAGYAAPAGLGEPVERNAEGEQIFGSDPMICMYEGRGIYQARSGHYYAGSGASGVYILAPVRQQDVPRLCGMKEADL